jgi:tetratricopeptide (TPR) repeat protein
LCTVQIVTNGGKGSGFFVGTGTILTCAHVVEDSQRTGSPVSVKYMGQMHTAAIREYAAKPFPDLALLKIELEDHPAVLLESDVQRNDALYGFGFHDEFLGGEGVEGKYEALSWFDDARTQELIKFSDTLIVPGFSGGPLLNLRTGAVCGVIKRTLGENAPMGGRAVPVRYAVEQFNLRPEQEAFHQHDPRWSSAQAQEREVDQKGTLQVAKQDVLVYEVASNPYARERLYGREDQIDKINGWLDTGSHVLLYGLAASGKTALAATIADQRLEAGKGEYIWIQLKTIEEEDVLDGLIRHFLTERDRERTAGQGQAAKIQALKRYFEQSPYKLWVIDDALHGPSLNVAMQVAPQGMGVLVTSRINYGPGQTIDQTLEVGNISPQAAEEMLVELSGREELRRNPALMPLLQVLGFHPYSIEIASRQLSLTNTDMDELLEMIQEAPDDLEMPGDFAEHGRESMKKLLDAVVANLKAPTADVDKDRANQAILRVFKAFGAFFAPGATIDLLATYLDQKNGETIRALRGMAGISLAREQPNTRFNDIHDLVFSYARSLWAKESGGDYSKSLEAVTAFMENHAQDFTLLASEMANILGAAQQALKDDAEIFLKIISILARQGYTEHRGYTPEFLKLMDEAIRIARDQADGEMLHYLLSRRGNAYFNRSEYASSAECYEEALRLAPNWYREMILTAVLGKVDTCLKHYEEAESHFRESETIVAEHDNPADHDNYVSGRIFILQQKISAAHVRQDYRQAKNLAVVGLRLSGEAGDALSEALFKTNLGTFEIMLGAQSALALHQAALVAAEGVGDQQILATAYYGLAIDSLVLDEYEKAQEYIRKAEALYKEYGDLEKLNQLTMLAKTFQKG